MATDLMTGPKPNGKIGADLIWKLLTAVTLGTVLWIGATTVENRIKITANRSDLDRNTERTKDRYSRTEAQKDLNDVRASLHRIVDLVLELERSRGGRNINQELEKITERLSAIEAKLGIEGPKDETNP